MILIIQAKGVTASPVDIQKQVGDFPLVADFSERPVVVSSFEETLTKILLIETTRCLQSRPTMRNSVGFEFNGKIGRHMLKTRLVGRST